ncbi:hypothetical protein HMPREF9078_02299 [Capnocytophaga sp. oral taxon 380 str. F0488]|nr:hypothetical protein HMPREF9078_02299 [Capnocytophaga sp. oral taxon 380 str. F0488]
MHFLKIPYFFHHFAEFFAIFSENRQKHCVFFSFSHIALQNTYFQIYRGL